MRVGGAASAPPHASVRGFADAGMTTPAAPRNIPAAQGHVPVHRLSEEQRLSAERYDLDGRGRAQGQILACLRARECRAAATAPGCWLFPLESLARTG